MSNRQWSMPAGVDRGTWDYVSSSWIADQYDKYFKDHPLFSVDQSIISEAFGPPSPSKTIVDLGCGTGRALLPMVQAGFQGVGVDLSIAMLKQLKQRATESKVSVTSLHANLVDLSCVQRDSFAHGMCLFSTLGMIKGRTNRHQALQEFRRVIQPDGRLVLHVHNYWYNLWDPGGPWWLLKSLVGSAVFRDRERGDKHYEYRGLTNMFLHVFSKPEIRRDLQNAGWKIQRFVPLRPITLEPWTEPAWYKFFNAVGWVIVCE